MLRAYRFSRQIADAFNKALKNRFETLSEVSEGGVEIENSGGGNRSDLLSCGTNSDFSCH